MKKQENSYFFNTTKLFAINKIQPNKILIDTMFKIIKSKNIQTTDDFTNLITELYTCCDQTLESMKKPRDRNRKIRKYLAIIYLSWDLLVEKLITEKFLIANMIKEASYKKALELEINNKK